MKKNLSREEHDAIIKCLNSEYNKSQEITDTNWKVIKKNSKVKDATWEEIKSYFLNKMFPDNNFRKLLPDGLVKSVEKVDSSDSSDVSSSSEEMVVEKPTSKKTVLETPEKKGQKRKTQVTEESAKKRKKDEDSEELANSNHPIMTVTPKKKKNPSETPSNATRTSNINNLFDKLKAELNVTDLELFHGLYANNGDVLNTIKCFKIVEGKYQGFGP
jgi:hypothetical protein